MGNINGPDNRGRMVILLIAGVPVIVVLLASWLWYFVVRGDLDIVGTLGTANRGALIQPPRRLSEAALYEQDGLPFRFSGSAPKWSLLIPMHGTVCDAGCEHRLYETRQIHLAMGKEFTRLRRLYVGEVTAAKTDLVVNALSDNHPVPPDFTQLLHDEHRGMKVLYASAGVLNGLFPEYFLDSTVWYLVDPAGWVMMSYNEQASYRDVMADLKFLLKNSSE